MAWLAVDKYKGEGIYRNKPLRSGDYWEDVVGYSFVGGEFDSYIELPKGTIERLVGKKLAWEDNPIELKCVIND